MYIQTVLLLICFLLNSHGARILAVLPTPSISHQVVFRPLTQELARRGHHVDIITPDPAFPKGGTPENITEVDVHDISYEEWKRIIVTSVTGSRGGLLDQMKLIYDMQRIVFDKQIHVKEVQEILKRKSDYYDLLLLEACSRPALVISHIFKAPVIQVSSFHAVVNNYDTIGAPTHPILYPFNTRQRIHNLTLWEKITELYFHYSLVLSYANQEKEEDELNVKNFGPDVPPLSELKNNVKMLFLNVHPLFEGNYPVPPGVVYMGGMHQKPQKALPHDLQSFLDSSKHGVIYMSFGTNADPTLLDSEKIQTFIRVYSKLPYDVLWKWNADVMPGKPDNVKIGKWFPQSDLLRHPNIKLFVTQGGLQSTDEAITAGVPLIGIPMLGDQWYNTEKYVHHKIGLQVDLESMNDEIFKNAVETIMNDESYRKNIIRIREIMNDQPQKPLDRATWWIEHVLRHGSDHLRSPAANISWSEYFELDLVFFVLALALVSISLVLVASYYLLKISRGILGEYKIKVS